MEFLNATLFIFPYIQKIEEIEKKIGKKTKNIQKYMKKDRLKTRKGGLHKKRAKK